MSSWMYSSADTQYNFRSGVLKGPMDFELGVYDRSNTYTSKSWSEGEGVWIDVNEDHANYIEIWKFTKADGTATVKIHTGQDGDLKLALPYDPSFEKALKDMREHLDPN